MGVSSIMSCPRCSVKGGIRSHVMDECIGMGYLAASTLTQWHMEQCCVVPMPMQWRMT